METTTKQITIDVTIPSSLIVCTNYEANSECVSDPTTSYPLKTEKRFRLAITDLTLFSYYYLHKVSIYVSTSYATNVDHTTIVSSEYDTDQLGLYGFYLKFSMVGSNTISAVWTLNPKTARMLQSSTATKAIRKIASAKVSAWASEMFLKFFAILALLLIV